MKWEQEDAKKIITSFRVLPFPLRGITFTHTYNTPRMDFIPTAELTREML
jgi:hypothetical protein